MQIPPLLHCLLSLFPNRHDAGDYLKFVQTASYVTSLLLLSARDAEAAAALPPALLADLRAEGRHGLTWLLKMWNDTSKTLFYQVFALPPACSANFVSAESRLELATATAKSTRITTCGGYPRKTTKCRCISLQTFSVSLARKSTSLFSERIRC